MRLAYIFLSHFQAHYPDQHMQWTLPRTGAWRQTSPLRYELNTEVPLSHGAWSGKNLTPVLLNLFQEIW